MRHMIVQTASPDNKSYNFYCRYLTSFWERACGLLGKTYDAPAVFITKCRAIHTCFMSISIDIAWIKDTGEVIATERNVAPFSLRSCKEATGVIERPQSKRPWIKKGSIVSFIEVNMPL